VYCYASVKNSIAVIDYQLVDDDVVGRCTLESI
jgi:hypothetical protein